MVSSASSWSMAPWMPVVQSSQVMLVSSGAAQALRRGIPVSRPEDGSDGPPEVGEAGLAASRVVSVISARMSSEESINQQIDMLVAGLCPESDDPAGCEAGLPDFWRAIAAILWPGYWDPAAEWMCGPTCAAPEDTTMTCEDCTNGIQGAID